MPEPTPLAASAEATPVASASWFDPLLDRIGSIGALPGASPTEALRRRYVVYMGCLMSLGGLVWGVGAMAIGLDAESAVPFSYVLITALNLLVYARSLAFERARGVQMIASLLLPFAFQWWLGGIAASGAMMLWSLVALFGSITFSDRRTGFLWLMFFASLTIGSAVLDPMLHGLRAVAVTRGHEVAILVANLVAVSTLTFGLAIALLDDRERLARAAERATATAQQLATWQSAILEGASVSIVATDRHGAVRTFNRGAERMLGWAADEVIGQHSLEVFHDPTEVAERAEALSRELGEAITAGPEALIATALRDGIDEREWSYVHRDGSRVPVLLSVAALRGSDGSVGGVLAVGVDLTARKQFERAAADARALDLGDRLVRALPLGVLGVTSRPPHRILFANPVAADMLAPVGAAASLVGASLEATFTVERWLTRGADGTSNIPHPSLADVIDAGEPASFEVEIRVAERDRVLPVACRVTPVEVFPGGEAMHVVTVRSIEERLGLEQRQRLADRVFQATTEAIVVTDESTRIMLVNPAFTRVTGWSQEEVLGRAATMLVPAGDASAGGADLWADARRSGTWVGETTFARKDGTAFPAWVAVSSIDGGSAGRCVALFSDRAVQKAQEAQLVQLASFDQLTGLPNRRTLQDRARMALARAHRAGRRVAVLFIDLDRFKDINDSLGHAVGDEVLIATAKRVSEVLRGTDSVARLGGDEFVVLAEDMGDTQGAVRVAVKVRDALARPIEVRGRALHVTPSIGVSVFPDDAADFETLLQHADTAMYRAKAGGRNGWVLFEPGMDAAAQERLKFEADLRRALTTDEFVLHFQPQWAGKGSPPFSWEALVRWNHPRLGLIPPLRFIPLAEETGLIVPLGEYVLDRACVQLARWDAQGLGPFQIAVNLSARQFRQQDLVERVLAILQRHGIDPARLELELTESTLMDDPAAAGTSLCALKHAGIKLAIDDFGTGHSSLGYLKHLPVDRIKLDRTFLHDVTTDPRDAAIVDAVVSFSRALGIAVLAEGVETEAQHALLLSRGCTEAQGYLLGRPMAGADTVAFLERLGRPASPA